MSTGRPGHELSRNLVYLLKQAYYRMNEIGSEALRPHGVDGREFGVLLALHGDEPASQQQVSQRLGVDRTTMVAILDALEAKGLVARRPHPEDRRRNAVELTETGHAVLRKAIEVSDAAEDEFLAPLDPEDAERLRASLRKIVLPPEG